MRVNELPDRLTHWGVPWGWVAGAERRGNEFPTRPDGVLRHWIGSAGRGLSVVTNGRPDLTGPLAQANQTRDVDPRTGLDFVWVVATGKANHAGEGILNGISGNYLLLGLEIDWAGPSEYFPPMRKLTSELVIRAMLDCCAGTDTNDVGEHREYARPVGRKIDTNLSGDELRQRMRTITPFRPGDDDLTPDEHNMLKNLHDTFAGGFPNNGPGDPTSRVIKVLDGAMWNKERINDVGNIAKEAKAEAAKANATLAALCEHFNIEVPKPT